MTLSCRHSAALVIAGALVSVPLLAGAIAGAATPRVTFNGHPVSVHGTQSCPSRPNFNSVTVSPGATVDFVNNTGTSAVLWLGDSSTSLPYRALVPVTFTQGPASITVSMLPNCALDLGSHQSMTVQVTAPSQSPSTPISAPMTSAGGSGPGAGSGPPASASPTTEQTEVASPTPAKSPTAGRTLAVAPPSSGGAKRRLQSQLRRRPICDGDRSDDLGRRAGATRQFRARRERPIDLGGYGRLWSASPRPQFGPSSRSALLGHLSLKDVIWEEAPRGVVFRESWCGRFSPGPTQIIWEASPRGSLFRHTSSALATASDQRRLGCSHCLSGILSGFYLRRRVRDFLSHVARRRRYERRQTSCHGPTVAA